MTKGNGYKITYTHSGYGQVTKVKTVAINGEGNAISGGKTMVQSTQYNLTDVSMIFGSVNEEKNYDGITTKHYYDQNNGKLKKLTYSNGLVAEYV